MSITRKQRPPYVDALDQRVLVFDGAMGTSIDTFTLTAEDYGGAATEGCRDYLVLTRPDVIAQIHESFFEVGCDVVETCTFQSTRLRLDEWGLADKTYELNAAAAALARRAADKFTAMDGCPRFVAGSMGPTGKLPSSDNPDLSDITFAELVALFDEQARALIDGGVDVLLIETSQDILEVKAAILGCQQAIAAADRPVALQAQVTLDINGRMLLGTEIGSALATIEALGVDAVGLNCSTGPEHMRETIRYLTSHTTLPVSCVPNAGIPLNVGGDAVYPLKPEPMAAILGEFVRDLKVRIVGGCCGSTPEHLRLVCEQVRLIEQQNDQGATDVTLEPFVSSGMKAVLLHQDPRPLIVGERVNSLGSRKVKRLLLKDDYQSIVDIAREQVDGGAHVLDVCVAMTERADEAEQMVKLVKLLSMTVDAPLMFDSTETDVLEAALQIYPGRPILNSTSLEGGRGQKIDQTLPLAVRYGAAVVCMAIDEEGMAHHPEDKLRICKRIYDIATQEYGLPPDALIFDVNVFPVTTGQDELRDEGWWTIEGVRLIKTHLPGALTSLGVSNLSFGVAPHARAALNSVFLYHAVQAGLDLAMVNPNHITPYTEIAEEQRQVCEDLIFNRNEDALAQFIAHFETVDANQANKADAVDPTEGMTSDEKIHYQILHRKRDGIEALIDTSLALRLDDGQAFASQNDAAVDVLNGVLLPAMRDVGDRFGAGELILPFVLQSAEVMKRSVAHLEQYLEKMEGTSKGRVVLATVYGDVHDIGKSLVNTILANNGYTVFDLGKQVPINTIIEKALEHQVDAIGLSALLVSTSKQMPLCVQELDRRGMKLPVLVGGAAINQQYGHRILFVEGDRPYEAGVFYCKDAFEGLETMDQLSSAEKRPVLLEDLFQAAAESMQKPRRGRMVMADVGREQGSSEARSAVSMDVPIPVPPFWGAQVIRQNRIQLDDVFACIDRNAHYRLQWGAKNAKGEKWQQLKAEFDDRVRLLQRDAERHGWLDCKIAYGYYPAQSAGNEVLVYEPASVMTDNGQGKPQEITRFRFPRQPHGERLCMADYFASVESGKMDVAVFQVVTVGDKITELCERLQQQGDYSQAYYIHGLGVSLAEALAEYINRLVRRSLGLPGQQGLRFSWGYPACPDLEDHTRLPLLLPMDTIGVSLTSAHQLVPEQSTAAIVLHHPEAKYFSIGSTLERADADVAAVLE
ncbi:MAG: methionine synthase [Chloroflexaceae bacterium]|nr:methionine synthase [Chloroflexaceae bacterium]